MLRGIGVRCLDWDVVARVVIVGRELLVPSDWLVRR